MPFCHLIVEIDRETIWNIALGWVNEIECQPEFKAVCGGEDLIILPKNVLDKISDQQLSYKLCNEVKKKAAFHHILEK